MVENDTRQSVFLVLVDRDASLTPSEIGDAVGESRQAVKYHLDKLVESGLVVRDGEAYRCQPVFNDPDVEQRFVEFLADLYPAMSERVEVDADVAPESHATAIYNCIRMFIALELLDPPSDQGQTAHSPTGERG